MDIDQIQVGQTGFAAFGHVHPAPRLTPCEVVGKSPNWLSVRFKGDVWHGSDLVYRDGDLVEISPEAFYDDYLTALSWENEVLRRTIKEKWDDWVKILKEFQNIRILWSIGRSSVDETEVRPVIATKRLEAESKPTDYWICDERGNKSSAEIGHDLFFTQREAEMCCRLNAAMTEARSEHLRADVAERRLQKFAVMSPATNDDG